MHISCKEMNKKIYLCVVRSEELPSRLKKHVFINMVKNYTLSKTQVQNYDAKLSFEELLSVQN